MKYLSCLLMLVFVLAACEEEQLQSLSGKWKLAHYYDTQTGTSNQEIKTLDQPLVLAFSDDGKTGTITRDSVQGPVIGIYEIGPHHRFSLLPIDYSDGSADWNARLFSSIATADFVKISANTLNITCNSGKDVLLFVREH